MSNKIGRPKNYEDEQVVSVTGINARSKLQEGSDRRAIVLAVLDNGGKATIKELCDKFGYDIRPKVMSLITAGWLGPKEAE